MFVSGFKSCQLCRGGFWETHPYTKGPQSSRGSPVESGKKRKGKMKRKGWIIEMGARFGKRKWKLFRLLLFQVKRGWESMKAGVDKSLNELVSWSQLCMNRLLVKRSWIEFVWELFWLSLHSIFGTVNCTYPLHRLTTLYPGSTFFRGKDRAKKIAWVRSWLSFLTNSVKKQNF